MNRLVALAMFQGRPRVAAIGPAGANEAAVRDLARLAIRHWEGSEREAGLVLTDVFVVTWEAALERHREAMENFALVFAVALANRDA